MRAVRSRLRCACTDWAIAAVLATCAAASGEPPAIDFAFIPADDVQPGGPAYDFRISRFEVRNDQFAAFLNDAMQNLANPRGQYVYFDIDSGNVYIHTTTPGAIGTAGSGTLLFGASVNPDVFYSPESGRYEVTPGREDHPAGGVTWYGAVKFCNWLTVATGLGAGERAYTEAPANILSGWHPVTITTEAWATRDLNNQERRALLGKLGYRLPMDGGDEGGDPSSYNEWYKGGAWDGLAGVNHVYGFGRETISGQDANFWCSGDPYEDPGDCIVGGTTPVGYYDGSAHNGAFQTNGNGNAYGLFDMSGNVWEWMQDQSFHPTDRRNRGGSFRSSPTSLELTIGAERSANSAKDSTGFRVVQSAVNELLVTPDSELANAGPWGGPYAAGLPTQMIYRVTNVSDMAIRFAVLADAPWVGVDYESPTGEVLPAYGFVDVTVSLAPQCAHEMNVGLNTATVAVVNLEDGWRANRSVRLTVTEPLTLTPPGPVTVSIPFGASPPQQMYTLASQSQSAVHWSANWVDMTAPPTGTDWLRLNGVPHGATGVIEPLATAEIALSFVTEGLAPQTYTAMTTFTDECTGAQFARSVSLTIVAPFAVTPVEEAVSTGVFGGPFSPQSHVLTIKSLVTSPVDWRLTLEPVAPATDADWVEVDLAGGALGSAGAETRVTAALTSAAHARQVGRHSARLVFEQLVDGQPSGFSVERLVTLEVSGLLVNPTGDVIFRGPLGGPFEPDSQLYTLRNTGLEEMAWTAEFHETTDPPSGRDWLELSEAAGVILNPQGTADVTVHPSPQSAALDTGTYTGEVRFTSTATGAQAVRMVTVIVGTEGFAMDMAVVPPQHVQPGGPGYLYRIGRYEVTNEEFVRFLNDAKDNPDGGRGEFLEHDTAGGVVSLTGDGTVLFDATFGGAIALVNDRYVLVDGKGRLPVVGVSWYGALKFCNWMTLIQGMDDPDQRVYHEGPTAEDWYPLLAPPELLELRGYRLPMDGQSAAAGPYNEWHKAAAWINTLHVNAVYGFGRDTLSNADANFRDSGDPYEPGPSPVGFFNGVNIVSEGGGRTNATANGYGLYDMTGNVAEWVHDVGYAPTERALRGGHFDNLVGSALLKNNGRGSVPADATLSFLGFRVVQAVQPGDLQLTQDAVRAAGLAGGPYSRDTFTLEITNLSEQTADNITISVDADWLEVEGVAPRQVPPGSTILVPLRIAATPGNPGVSPAPPGDFVLVRGTDNQSEGPDYDYWVSRTEVTNVLFAGFLNDARANATSEFPDARCANMYFDLDSGSVYINDGEPADEGQAAPSDTLTTLLYDAQAGRIHFGANAYMVEQGFESHPVVGVSWYGAIKYCNWLTIRHGIPVALRAYEEAPSPHLEGWHPVVVDDATWVSGPMSSEARRFLIEDTLGYRLPMDDEAGGAAAFNEWYKAASRKGVDEQGNPVFGAPYGFGRDGAVTGPDANYFASGETATDSTTPVGFFTGIYTLFAAPTNCYPPAPAPATTSDTDNGYGLYDACGNVAEWAQDLFGGDFHLRATRGGSWRDPADSTFLTTMGRRSLAPETPDDQTGFRVVRGTGHAATVTVTDHLSGTAYRQHFILDLRAALQLEPLTGLTQSGMYGDAFAGRGTSYTLTNDSASEMEWNVAADRAWVDLTEQGSGHAGGSLAGGQHALVDVEINAVADDLGPGTHTTIITFYNVTTAQTLTRNVVLTIAKPILIIPVDPEPHVFTGVWHGPFESPLPSRTFNMISQVNYDLRYDVSARQPWLTVEPLDPLQQLTGTLRAGVTIAFESGITDVAATLPVGTHQGSIRFAFVDPAKPWVADAIEQQIALTVDEPIVIGQNAEPWLVGPNPDPAVFPPQAYTLVNNVDVPIEVSIGVDANWVNIPYTLIEVPPGAAVERRIPISLNENVLTMFDGEYAATITFEDTVTEIVQCRTIVLTIVEDISVAPFDDFVTAGIPGGPARPPFKVYSVTNVARDGGGPVYWQASVAPPGVDWILVNGAFVYEGVLDDGESTTVVISIDTNRTIGLIEGSHQGNVEFRVLPDGEAQSRAASLTISEPAFELSESLVAGAVNQPGGPAYSYNMGTFHTTNAEFVAFLNDAMENPDSERGQYMFFDTTTGEVYLNASLHGELGAGPGLHTLKMFSPAASGQVELVAGRYLVVAEPVDFSDHPVTGVSWYGAVKYCNWLTIDQGMLASERCYTEDTAANPQGWHPATISAADWLRRDLTDGERLKLVTRYRGCRLPMDDGCNNVDVTTDGADAYNEWYKAASYKGQNARGDAVFGSVYGFGRDGPLGGADANFLDSGDPWDDGTTMVGYFDGSVREGWFVTAPNGNGFGIFDMTGNAYQWIQGRFNTHPNSINFRTLRGGSWNTPANLPDLRTKGRTYSVPHLTDGQVGFRVVRVLEPPTGDVDADGDVDASDYMVTSVCLTGPGVGLVPGCGVFDLDTDGDIDLHDFATFETMLTSATP